jgi:hypothetical protein
VTPAVLLGPTMTITLTTGSCAVAKDLNGTGALVVTCDPPTITWVKARADQLLTGFDVTPGRETRTAVVGMLSCWQQGWDAH